VQTDAAFSGTRVVSNGSQRLGHDGRLMPQIPPRAAVIGGANVSYSAMDCLLTPNTGKGVHGWALLFLV
jgi:hypothetical protein